ncbi:MAG TPA: hypothetical protein OIM04_01470 [Oscillospiraceae bacterium]|nr:hypothetical protein [Oscillospiraceae bacterium]
MGNCFHFTLIGFELGGYFLFYDKDAITVKEVFRSNLLSQENALGKVKVTGFLRREWVAKSQKLWAEGNSIYLAGQGEDGTHHQTKYLREEDYLPIGSIIKLDGRDFRVDHVNFMFKSVSLQDMDLTNSGQPIFRSESLPHIRELYEQQQDEIVDVSPEKTVDYKVGDEVVVDLPTRTIEGKIGYVGETDVRIDTSAHGQSWDNEVLNKQQFEDGLRRDEPTPDEELDKLPISTEVNGEWQTFPNAAAADKALNAEPVPEAAENFHITDDNLGVGGPKQKFARNIEAIQTLRTLEQEHRGATTEEQQVLSQYQTLENKQKFISQIMTSKSPSVLQAVPELAARPVLSVHLHGVPSSKLHQKRSLSAHSRLFSSFHNSFLPRKSRIRTTSSVSPSDSAISRLV